MKNKIKLLLIMPELYHGGAEKQFRNIASLINKEKFDVTVAIEHSYKSRDAQLEKTYIRENSEIKFVSLSRLNSVDGKLKRYSSAILINCEILPFLISHKPDIVMAYTLLGLKTAKLSNILGATFIYGERNSGAYPDEFYRNQRVFLDSTKEIVANSKSAQKRLKAHQLDVSYIPNGVETVSTLPEEQLNQFTVVVPARIAKIKNQEFLIRALSRIHQKVKVQFVGKVEDAQYKVYLEQLASDLNVRHEIEFVNYTSDVQELYRKASLIVLPSISEGFSNVILESYLYGRLCLLSDIEMNRDIGAPGQRYFSLNDTIELENQLQEIIDLPSDKKDLEIERNHNYAVENFSMEKMTMRYEKLFMKWGRV